MTFWMILFIQSLYCLLTLLEKILLATNCIFSVFLPDSGGVSNGLAASISSRYKGSVSMRHNCVSFTHSIHIEYALKKTQQKQEGNIDHNPDKPCIIFRENYCVFLKYHKCILPPPILMMGRIYGDSRVPNNFSFRKTSSKIC